MIKYSYPAFWLAQERVVMSNTAGRPFSLLSIFVLTILLDIVF